MTSARHAGYAILVAAPFPLALAGLLTDWAYTRTFEVQWRNFADWLVSGSLLFAGLALAWALLSFLVHRRWREPRGWLAPALIAAFFVVQFINALVHAKDGFAGMPGGLLLSMLATLLGLVAAVVAIAATLRGRPAVAAGAVRREADLAAAKTAPAPVSPPAHDALLKDDAR